MVDDGSLLALEVTSRSILGLRNALLEAMTDLIYSGSEDVEAIAGALRVWLAGASDPLDSTSASFGVASTGPRARIHPAAGVTSGFVLAATPDVFWILARAVAHVQDTLLEFEIPIRLGLEPQELAELGRGLGELDLG